MRLELVQFGIDLGAQTVPEPPQGRATARKRVVLKWPQRGDPMAGIAPPSHRITGKSTRYDVFMVG